MRGRNILAFAVSFLLAAAVLAQGSGEAKAKSAPKSAAAKAVDFWGDRTKGAFGGLIKFPAGFSAALHTHTSEFRVVVVSGTFIHGPKGKPEVRLGPGSYLKQPGGNYRHTTVCDKASECVVFIESNGKFDIKMVDEGKAPAKK
jgi:quercetin dioxygenase-like cupin family protein